MDYTQTLDYLFSQLPMYQRIGAAAYKADLSNTHQICALLGNPERGLKCVHIAGTNGKGSVASMVASVLQEAGLKTGLYTSPHYKDFRERIRVNGKMISPEDVIVFVKKYGDQWQALKPSFFEITVGMAFDYFKNEGTDIAVIETGLGGRLDSTNVVTPEVAAITNVGFDHTKFLGTRIEQIAYEKGGIIKEGIPLVLGAMNFKARMVLEKMADEKHAPLVALPEKNIPRTDLQGKFQTENIRVALAIINQLVESGWDIHPDAVFNGLRKVQENTGYKGRWQILGTSPLIVADSAHNELGFRAILSEIEAIEFNQLHFVIGVVSDKEINEMLSLLPTNGNFYFCQASIERAMPAEELAENARNFGLRGDVYMSVPKAYEAARLYAGKNDLILISGSIFTVSEVI